MPPFVGWTICRPRVAVGHQAVHLGRAPALWIVLGQNCIQPCPGKKLQFPFTVPVFTGTADFIIDFCPRCFLNSHFISLSDRIVNEGSIPPDVDKYDLVIRIFRLDRTLDQLNIFHVNVKRGFHSCGAASLFRGLGELDCC